MSNAVLLFLCLALGRALRASGRVPDDAHQSINALVISVSPPVVASLHIPQLQLSRQWLIPVFMQWLLFAAVAACSG